MNMKAKVATALILDANDKELMTVRKIERDGNTLVDESSGLVLPVAELGIQGEHNVDNACAAALAARLAGVGREPPTYIVSHCR